MGLVKTRRLAAMNKQTSCATAAVIRQRAKAVIKPLKPRERPRNGNISEVEPQKR